MLRERWDFVHIYIYVCVCVCVCVCVLSESWDFVYGMRSVKDALLSQLCVLEHGQLNLQFFNNSGSCVANIRFQLFRYSLFTHAPQNVVRWREVRSARWPHTSPEREMNCPPKISDERFLLTLAYDEM